MGENKLVDISIIFIGAIFLVLMLKELQGFIRPFAIAVILTLLFMPLVRWSRKRGIPSALSIIGVLLAFVIIFSGLGILVAGEGARFAKTISEERLREGIGPVERQLESVTISGKSLGDLVDRERLSALAGAFVKGAINGATQLFGELFIVFLFLIFLLPSHDMIIGRVKENVSKEGGKRFESALQKIERSIAHYLLTKTSLSLLTALSVGLILLLFGGELILSLMIITFVLEFVPNIGSTISVITTLLVYSITVGFGWQVLLLGALLLVVQNFFANFVEPKLTGKSIQLSPIFILLSLFFWSWVWGLPGMVMSVPLTIIIKITLENVRKTEKAASLMG